MAVASTPFDYSSKIDSKSNHTNSNKQLDFYESMYHFKKMFPKFDSEVIEAILRSNQGSVDKTLDQLLTMNLDVEKVESQASSNSNSAIDINSQSFVGNIQHDDSPPSYHEAVSSKNLVSNSEITIDTAQTVVTVSKIDDKVTCNINTKIDTQIRSQLNTINETCLNETKYLENLNNSKFIANFNQMLIGDLAKDFLRVKLTSDQIKSYKHNIKSAKRDEIAAILNNKTPKHPELSFELKRQLNNLMNQLDESDIETDLNDWEEKYKSLLKTYENKRLQIIQDEYLAKLLQNEEFLNEIKTDQDFIETLNDETNTRFDYNPKYSNNSDQINDYSTTTLSNAELVAKLTNMGKFSRQKLNKLASKFSKKYSKSNKDSIEFNSIDFNSLDSNNNDNKNDILVDLRDESYDLDRIKAAEEFSTKSGTISKSRYKKVYKSFKSVIKRNNSNTNSNMSTINENNSIINNSSNYKYTNFLDSNNNNLDLFQNGYSYDDAKTVDLNKFTFIKK